MTDARHLSLRGLCLGRRALEPGTVHLVDGAFSGAPHPDAVTIDLPDGWVVTPGLVDLQVNGYAGHEVDSPGALPEIAAALARDGVVAFCPTLVSRPLHAYPDAVARLADAPSAGARVLGLHLEGPFLSPSRPGAHDTEALRTPDPHAVNAVAAFEPSVVTLAPEVPGGLDAVVALRAAGAVVSLGHTEADAATVRAAADRGARMITHVLNAMPGITAREASPAAQALQDDRLFVSLITDGHHVAPEVCRLVASAVGARLVLTSDASALAGTDATGTTLGDRPITRDGETARDDRGRLAGGALPLWRCVHRAVEMGIPRAHALWAACGAPREALGRRPAEARASLTVVDADDRPRAVMVDGAWLRDPREVLGG